MKKRWIAVFSVLIIAAFLSGALVVSKAGTVFILNTHSVWTNDDGLTVVDGENGCEYRVFEGFETISAWSDYNTTLFPAIAQFRGTAWAEGTKSCPDPHTYDFTLIETTSSEGGTITGVWNVYRDNVLRCSLCDGSALDMDVAVNGSYRVVVDDPVNGPSAWQFHGYVDQRKDFTTP